MKAPIYKEIPEDWVVVNGATTAPNGYVLICNNKADSADKERLLCLR